MRTKDFMTKSVVTCNQTQTLNTCAGLMFEKNLSAMPVTDDENKLVGIITVSDFIGKEVNIPHALAPMKQIFNRNFSSGDIEDIYRKTRDTTLEKVMTKKIHTVTPETSLSDVVNLMIESKLKRIPVNQDGKLVGIITRKDIIKAYSYLKSENFSGAENFSTL